MFGWKGTKQSCKKKKENTAYFALFPTSHHEIRSTFFHGIGKTLWFKMYKKYIY